MILHQDDPMNDIWGILKAVYQNPNQNYKGIAKLYALKMLTEPK